MKTLNGYEIVDNTARTTKQNTILTGSDNPSSSTGSNGDVYIATNSSTIKSEIVNLIYPVGSIYISTQSANPSSLFGGTWEAYGQGRTLIGAGTGNDGSTSMSFTASSTYGEYKHKLTVNEMPAHIHQNSMRIQWFNDEQNGIKCNGFGTSNLQVDREIINTGAMGGSASHNNIQPSICVYFWKRTA